MKIASPRRLLAQLDAAELAHWRIMYRLGAFGSRADEQRAGVIAAAAGNAPRFSKKSGEMWQPVDYFPAIGPHRTREERAKQTAGNLRQWRRFWTRN